MPELRSRLRDPSQRVKFQWGLSTCIWTMVIFTLSAINYAHDAIVVEKFQYNDPWWLYIQEWCLFYLFTPITFALLDKLQASHLLNQRGYLLTLVPMYCSSMAYQAIFDLFVYDDYIPSTLVYFAPSHFVVIAATTLIWHALWKAPAQLKSPNVLLVDQGRHKTLLPLDDIVNLNAASNYVDIYTQQDTYIKRVTLTHLAQSLPASTFIRCHRSHMVNLSCIVRIERKPSGSALIHLNNGQIVPLSKRYYSHVKTLSAA